MLCHLNITVLLLHFVIYLWNNESDIMFVLVAFSSVVENKGAARQLYLLVWTEDAS